MKKRFTIIDRYIFKRMVVSFFYLLLIMALISCVIDYSEKADAFVKHNISAAEIGRYFLNFIPYIVLLLFPLFIFISTIFFTSKMAYKSEIIAILASGVPFTRMLRPYMAGAVLICSFAWTMNNYIIPRANKFRIHFENKYINGIPTTSDRNVHLRLSKSEYVYMESYDFNSNIGYKFTLETMDGTLLKQRIMADRASYDSVRKVWTLFNAVVRTNDSLKEKLVFEHKLEKKLPTLSPKDLLDNNTASVALTTPELNEFIHQETIRGRESLNYLYIEKYRRTAQPFAGILMVVMAASIASKKIRGGSGFHMAIGVAISALYMMMLQFSNTYSTKAGLNPLLATWIPNIIFAIVALYFLRREMK